MLSKLPIDGIAVDRGSENRQKQREAKTQEESQGHATETARLQWSCHYCWAPRPASEITTTVTAIEL